MRALTLSRAIDGVTLSKKAAGLAVSTLAGYKNAYRIMLEYFDAKRPIASITRNELLQFFAYLQDDYVSEPNGILPRGKFKLSKRSIQAIRTSLSVLWGWAASEGYVEENIVSKTPAPRVEPPVIETFTKEEAEAMLAACDRSRTWKEKKASTARRTATRDRAIILALLSTGLRADELCNIRLRDVNMATNNIFVRGKRNKERFVSFGKRTANAMWRLITERTEEEGATEEDLLFTVSGGEPMSRHILHLLLKRIGERAGVKRVYPHRFRHTFAINYLRNGGDLLTLQSLLGHTDLEMVRRYARVAAADCAAVHRRADPVDNWKL